MDAAYSLFKKSALFLVTTLLAVAPVFSQTSQLQVNPTSVTLTSGEAVPVDVTASGGAEYRIYRLHAPLLGYLAVTGDTQTPGELYFQLANSSCGHLHHEYHAASHQRRRHRRGDPGLLYSGRGWRHGAFSRPVPRPSRSALRRSRLPSRSSDCKFRRRAHPISRLRLVSPSGSWLSVSQNNIVLNSSTPVSLVVYGNATNLSANTYTGSITLTPSAGRR